MLNRYLSGALLSVSKTLVNRALSGGGTYSNYCFSCTRPEVGRRMRASFRLVGRFDPQQRRARKTACREHDPRPEFAERPTSAYRRSRGIAYSVRHVRVVKPPDAMFGKQCGRSSPSIEPAPVCRASRPSARIGSPICKVGMFPVGETRGVEGYPAPGIARTNFLISEPVLKEPSSFRTSHEACSTPRAPPFYPPLTRPLGNIPGRISIYRSNP